MKSPRYLLPFLTSILTVAFSPGPVSAQDDMPSFSAKVDVLNKYIWRGWNLNKNSIVIQPSVVIGCRGWGFKIWGNLDTNQYLNHLDRANWNETDFILSYERGFGMLNLSGGFIYYAIDYMHDLKEFYLSLGLDTILSPRLTVHREISHLEGWYFNLRISHSFQLPKEMTLDLTGSAGYYISQSDTFVKVTADLVDTQDRYRAFHDGLISARLNLPFCKYFTLTPILAYSFPLSKRAEWIIKADSWSHESSFLFGGVSISVSF